METRGKYFSICFINVFFDECAGSVPALCGGRIVYTDAIFITILSLLEIGLMKPLFLLISPTSLLVCHLVPFSLLSSPSVLRRREKPEVY